MCKETFVVFKQSKVSSVHAGSRKVNCFLDDLTLVAIQRFIAIISCQIILKNFFLKKETNITIQKKNSFKPMNLIKLVLYM